MKENRLVWVFVLPQKRAKQSAPEGCEATVPVSPLCGRPSSDALHAIAIAVAIAYHHNCVSPQLIRSNVILRVDNTHFTQIPGAVQ
ncbi:hypothetical protein P886_4492 [Alteromonadaceae bacterium 2753L.S.0a.02]|nr:hypothetical protein P886_4492 [Alteromonadaceae bacterium 2753L.S.0a.02]